MAKRIEARIYPRDEHGDLLDGRHRRVWWRPVPAGLCHLCWIERRERRGRFYVWGYPSLTPGRGRCCCYCDECVERCRSIGIQLIPAGARGSD